MNVVVMVMGVLMGLLCHGLELLLRKLKCERNNVRELNGEIMDNQMD